MARALVCVAFFVLAWIPSAFALDPALDVRQYVHTAWRVREGFTKGAIRSITQTHDGYLWLGTDLGLLRFDGVRTLAWQPPPNQPLPSNVIVSLLTAHDGALWIGTDRGLASWKDGQLVRYPALEESYIGNMIEDRAGTVWTTRFLKGWTLCEIEQVRVTCYGEDAGFGAGALGLYEDATGRLWLGTGTGVWRWRPGPPTFYRLPPQPNGIQGLSGSSDGSLLVSNAGGISRFVDGDAEMAYPFPPSIQPSQARRLLRDRDGGLWAATATHGLVHVHEGIIDLFSRSDGLSGDAVSAIYEDREGSVWVATVDGLDRFHGSKVVSYSVSQGLSSPLVASVLASTDGSVWVGTFDGLNRWINGHVTVYREHSESRAVTSGHVVSRSVREITGTGIDGGVGSVFEDSQHRVWLSTARHVGYMESGRFVALNGVPDGLTRAIVEDGHKALWIVKPFLGLFRVGRDGRDIEPITLAALGHNDVVSAAAANPLGEGLWIGFFRGGVTYFAGHQVRASYTAADGLAEGRVSSLYVDPSGTLWVAADGGLSLLKNGRVATLTSRNGLPCDMVGWVIEDASRSVWLGMACGLVRIARSEIDAWIAAADIRKEAGDVTPRVQTAVFDHTDGVRTSIGMSYYTAPVARSSDGKLWFVSQGGVSVVDPARLAVNSLPPPVHVEQVIADRKTYDVITAPDEQLRLPPLTRALQIDYTALSFVAPEKMQFRYKLEGRDTDWQAVGTRRQAFYDNLRPRNYRFRVVASNNDGVWNEAGASVEFAIAPAYYQTNWFRALSVGLIVAIAMAAYRVRLHIVRKHEREITALNERLMKAQEQERIRIAGELHDGVMQQLLAVTMKLGTAKRRIPGDSDAKAAIDKIQEQLIQVGTDIRQLSHELHPPMLQEAGLPEAMRAYCEQFSASSGVPVSCEADDAVQDLSRGAALALFRIVQEALGNAAKHASPKHITVRLTRSGGIVSLAVSDDGGGFDSSRPGASGGLGLVMMRERASQLNGKFEFESAPGRGTTITVSIPFR